MKNICFRQVHKVKIIQRKIKFNTDVHVYALLNQRANILNIVNKLHKYYIVSDRESHYNLQIFAYWTVF